MDADSGTELRLQSLMTASFFRLSHVSDSPRVSNVRNVGLILLATISLV